MNELAFIVDGRLSDITGGQIFNRRMVEGMRERGWTVRVVELADPAARARIGALPPGLPAVLDEVTLPRLAADIPAMSERLYLLALVHHPISEEYGSPPEELHRCVDLERRLLPLFRGALCPSRRTAAAVAAFGVPADRIAITPPGIAKPAPPPPRRGRVRRLLYVANVIPRKNHTVLVDALAQLRDLDWCLDCIGALDRDPGYARAVADRLVSVGLAERVRLGGLKPAAEVAHAYATADAFVSASLHEGYGVAWAEAMAWGLPQVTTTAGAVAEIVPPEAGLLVPSGDPDALAAAIRQLIENQELAARLAAGARAAAMALPDWPAAIRLWEAGFDRLTA